MAKDFYWPNVVSSLHFEGANGSTTFTDQRGKTYTKGGAGSAIISTSQHKFGSSSLSLDGSAYLNCSSQLADFDFGTEAFTIEGFFYFNELDRSYISLFGMMDSAGNTAVSVTVPYTGSPPNTVLQLYNGYAGGANTASGVINTNTWYHVAVTRSGNTVRLFVNGMVRATLTVTQAINANYGTQPGLGLGRANGMSNTYLNGFIDDFRVTKGVARYVDTFTPPAATFPDDGPSTIGGTILDSNGNPVARTVRAYRRDTGALLGQGVSNVATGTYSIAIDHDQEVQVVLLDDALGTVENDQILRTVPV